MTGASEGSAAVARGITSVGCAVVDMAKIIDRYPEPDHLAMITEVSLSSGGPALNMAVNLRQLGVDYPVSFHGALGDDEHGRFLLAECDRLGIDRSGFLVLPGVATSFTDVFLERSGGRRTMFYHAGANDAFDAAGSAIEQSGARILHAGSPGALKMMDTPIDGDRAGGDPSGGTGWSRLLARGQAAGMHTNMEMVDLDDDLARALVTPCLPHLSSIVINELEAGAITGITSPSPDAEAPVDWPTLEAMALRLVEMGVSTLAVVHFPAGAVAAAPGGHTWRQGSVRLPPERVRSAVGAGDAFAAGVIHGFHEEWEVEDCLRLAVASAAACVQEAHTSAGIKPVDDCLAEADQLGYRPTAPRNL